MGVWIQRDRGLGGETRHEPASLRAKNDETGLPFHIQPTAQIQAFRDAWKEAGHAREPRVSVKPRTYFALVDERDRAYFGHGGDDEDRLGFIDGRTRSIFGRSYAAEPDVLIEQLRQDEQLPRPTHCC